MPDCEGLMRSGTAVGLIPLKHYLLILTFPVLCWLHLSVGLGQEFPRLGVWSWKQDSFKTASARDALLGFCESEGITHIDQHVSIKKVNGVLEVQNTEALRQLVSEAAGKGIAVNALRGERTMFFAANHERVAAELRTLIAFNKSLPESISLAGVKYDVEPYLTKQWKAGGEARQKVMTDYLVYLERANQVMDELAPDLELSVDVPFWWDKPEYSIKYAGKDKKFVHHIQDRTDWIGIMSYRRAAKDVLRFCESERTYAETNGSSIAIGLNAIKTGGSEEVTTFFGYPPKIFREAVAELKKAQEQSKSVRLIMLHDYQAFSEYLSREE